MKKKLRKIITEDKKTFMSKREKKLKQKLINLLKDDGHGHKHAKYAQRLADFDINIVYYDPSDPSTYDFTAAISFDDGIIYISEGFIQKDDEKTFNQLNVLMRHEMAHNLLAHQLRMMHKIEEKYGKDGYSHIKMSQSLHDLNNIIEDFEISNSRYTAEDKETVKNMLLNGKLIGGLVTEDHRSSWEKMSVLDMYDAVNDEINNLHDKILAALQNNNEESAKFFNDLDFLGKTYFNLYKYTNVTGHSQLPTYVDKFMDTKIFNKFSETLKSITASIINAFNNEAGLTKDMLNIYDRLLAEISTSKPNEKITLTVDGKTLTSLHTPEEKVLAVEILKGFKDLVNLHDDWFAAVKRAYAAGNYTYDEVQQIIAELSKGQGN